MLLATQSNLNPMDPQVQGMLLPVVQGLLSNLDGNEETKFFSGDHVVLYFLNMALTFEYFVQE